MTTSAAAQRTTLVAGSTTGVDIANSSGTLTPVSRLKTLNGELTHPSVGSGTYIFMFTAPSSPGTGTLYAIGVAGGFPGSWNYASNGTITVSSVASINETTPTIFPLEQHFPNLFNPTTATVYSLRAARHVTLTIYDLTGRAAIHKLTLLK